MSEGIEIKAGIKAQTAAPRPDLHVKQDKPLPPNPSTANGSENGGVYLELSFRTERGRDRQQALLTTFSVENSDETGFVLSPFKFCATCGSF